MVEWYPLLAAGKHIGITLAELTALLFFIIIAFSLLSVGFSEITAWTFRRLRTQLMTQQKAIPAASQPALGVSQ